MEELLQWINPETIINKGGIYLLAFVIFAETGLFIGFFLPGDSLLFVAGLLSSTQPDLLGTNVVVLIATLISAAILGNLTGYGFGRKVGEALYNKKDTWLFKKKYIEMTRNFYDRHGMKAIMLGRFLPFIRTFAPILAGIIKMNFKQFFIYTVIGGIAWITIFTLLGYFLGQVPGVKENLKWIVIGLIIVTLIPVATTYLGERKRMKEKQD